MGARFDQTSGRALFCLCGVCSHEFTEPLSRIDAEVTRPLHAIVKARIIDGLHANRGRFPSFGFSEGFNFGNELIWFHGHLFGQLSAHSQGHMAN